MALFGKKKSDPEQAAEAPTEVEEAAAEDFTANAAKAARFFEHARAMHDSANYEYAVTLWLQGLRQDPTSMTGLESFYESAEAFVAKRKKFGPTKDQQKNFGGKGAVERYLQALLNWGTKPTDTGAAIKALEASVKLNLDEPGYWIGERALTSAWRNKKPSKDALVRIKDLLIKVGAYDLAVKAGEAAMQLDPSDADLKAEMRNLSAQATMSSGGYETSGEEGGFRRNIRDADAQRRLEEESRISRSEDAATRVVEAAREDYESRPQDTAAIQKYARALLERGTTEDEKSAYDLLTKAHQDTGEFRFRQQAGEVKLRQARRKLRELKQAADANPEDEEAQERLKKARLEFAKLEIAEYQARVAAYPTDLKLKYELGRRLYQVGQYQEAIQALQEAQRDAKNRASAMHYLGLSFLELGWQQEAVETLRGALEAHGGAQDETGLELRYGLMRALEKKAQDEQDLEAAEEAGKLASSIAMQQIGFRDIVQRRQAIQQLTKDLKAAAAS